MRKRVLAVIVFLAAWTQGVTAETLTLQVESAVAGVDAATEMPIVTLQLRPESVAAFGEFTKQRIGEPVQLRLGDRVLSAPIVREPILEGILIISGQMTKRDARELAGNLMQDGASLVVDGSDN